ANKYSRTDMGRSMAEITAALLEQIPTSASLTVDSLHRRFDIRAENGKLFQTESAVAENGKEAFPETHEVNWIIGSGANGFGALLKRGDFLFAAPPSFSFTTQSPRTS